MGLLLTESEGAALAVGDQESQTVWCGPWLLRPWLKAESGTEAPGLLRGEARLV